MFTTDDVRHVSLGQQAGFWATPMRRSVHGRVLAGRSLDLTSTDVADALGETVEAQRSRGLALRDGDGVRLVSREDLGTMDLVLAQGEWTAAPEGWYC